MNRRVAVLAGVMWLPWSGVVVTVPILQALASPPGAVEPLRTAPEVALTTTEGGEFRLSQRRGEIVVISFGYTLCPDVCPMTLAKLAQLRARLGAGAAEVRVVFVTLDPERDTPARLRAYTRGFDPTFVGLTGTPKAVAQARDAYGVIAGRRAVPGPVGYLVDHSTFVFVVDRAGLLRFMFPPDTSAEGMLQGVTALLR